MKNSIRCARSWQIQRLKRSFLQVRGLPFFDVLSTRVLSQFAERACGGRDRIFTPLVVLKAFLFQVLSQDGSCKHAVARVLSERLQSGQSANSINTGPYCKARQRLPRAPLENAVRESGQTLHQRAPSAWGWRGHRVVLADGTTALMPDTLDNQREFPQQGNQQPGLGFPIVRIVALISLGAGAVLDYALGPYQGKGSGESSLFSTLLHTLQPGDLLLADRYYCTYAIMALLVHHGVQGLFQKHAQRKPHWHRGERLGAKDHLIKWAKPPRKPVWMSAQDYLKLPPTLTIRELAVNGIVYVTTLSNPKRYPRRALAEHYRSRWTIELDLRSIKTDMAMERLRCKSPERVRKEIAAHLLAYNLVRANLNRAAQCFEKIPRQLSFKSALQLLNNAASQLLLLSGKALQAFATALLQAMALSPIGRQKRLPQPRAVKRRPKPYPLLTRPRHAAC